MPNTILLFFVLGIMAANAQCGPAVSFIAWVLTTCHLQMGAAVLLRWNICTIELDLNKLLFLWSYNHRREKDLLKDQNITPQQHCSQFHTRQICKDDEYELCNWCDAHKPSSTAEDKSIRCVPASYHWFECERAIAPVRERIKHKFDWGKKNDDHGDTVDDATNDDILQNDGNEELWINHLPKYNVIYWYILQRPSQGL